MPSGYALIGKRHVARQLAADGEAVLQPGRQGQRRRPAPEPSIGRPQPSPTDRRGGRAESSVSAQVRNQAGQLGIRTRAQRLIDALSERLVGQPARDKATAELGQGPITVGVRRTIRCHGRIISATA